MSSGTGISFSFIWCSGGGFQADGFHQFIEILDYALIEAVDLRSPLLVQFAVNLDGPKQACGKWGVYTLEELEENKGDRVAA
jgi:hypothetical protein